MSISCRLQPAIRCALTSVLVALLSVLIHSAAVAQVGMTSVQIGGLPITLIYPTAEPVKRVVQAGFEYDVAMDAPPKAGPHRLVVMSHGTGGSALSDHALAATMARAGFVVAQPLHAATTMPISPKPDRHPGRSGRSSSAK